MPGPQCHRRKAVSHLFHLWHPGVQAQQRQRGVQRVHRQQAQRHPQQDAPHQRGQQGIGQQQQWVAPQHHHHAQRTPQRRGPQTDVPIQIPRQVAVIPPAGVGQRLQRVACHPFHHGGHQRTEQEQEEHALLQFHKAHRNDGARHAVDDAQRPVEHAPVHIAAVDSGLKDHLQHPA